VVALAVSTTLAGPGPASADTGSGVSGSSGTYGGVFAGSGRAVNQLTDVDGFADWGNPGSMVEYDSHELVGGALIGRKFETDGSSLRIKFERARTLFSIAVGNRVAPVPRRRSRRAR